MLARINRLRVDRDLKQVFKCGWRLSTAFAAIYVLKRQASPVRVACICGKKVNSKAVARHKYQRWLRQLAREAIIEAGLENCDMVWVAQPNIAKANNLNEVKQAVWLKLEKIKKICH